MIIKCDQIISHITFFRKVLDYVPELTLPIKATFASTAHSPQPTAYSQPASQPDLPFSVSKSSIFDPNHYRMCTFDQILTWVGLFFTHFSKIAQILTLLAHFLVETLTLRALLIKSLPYSAFFSQNSRKLPKSLPYAHMLTKFLPYAGFFGPNSYLTRTCWPNPYLTRLLLSRNAHERWHLA